MTRIARGLWMTVFCLFPLAAGATTVHTDFASGVAANSNLVVGGSATYALGGSSVTVRAGNFSGSSVTLNTETVVENNRGGDDFGLGTCVHYCTGVGGEINYTNELLQVNLNAAETAGLSGFTFAAGSATGADTLTIYGSNIAGSLGTLLASIKTSDGDVFVAAAGDYQFLNFIDPNANGTGHDGALLGKISATVANAVPEPASLSILSVGLIGLRLFRRKEKKPAA